MNNPINLRELAIAKAERLVLLTECIDSILEFGDNKFSSMCVPQIERLIEKELNLV